MRRRNALFCLMAMAVVAAMSASTVLAETIFESFEGSYGPWRPNADKATTLAWHVTPSKVTAYDGNWSLDFTTNGTNDNGTVWVVRELELPVGSWDVSLTFNVTAAPLGTLNCWEAVGFIGLREPQAEADFTQSPEGQNFGAIESATAWKTCTMQRKLTVGSPAVAHVAFGYNVVWETVRTHHFDAVTLAGVPIQCGNGKCFGGENACNCPTDCGPPTASEASCTNGLDDDCDGLIDCADPNCQGNPACTGIVCDGDGICEPGETGCVCWMDCGPPPVVEGDCGNGVDDDCDGLVDCADTFDCGFSPECMAPSTYTLSVNITGQGTVTLNPAGGIYDPGTIVTLTANAASGWRFDHWAGALSGSTNPATLLMDGDKSVTAVFTTTIPAAPSNITATSLGGGRARVTWQDNSTNETGFEIQREKQVGKNWKYTTTITVGADVTTYTDSPGAGTFHYRVRAFNAAGYSAYTSWATVTVR
ncbi:MAG TPA: hypothetical protein VMV94_14465 [Phycisphaerae bacterium]|nr:hypothetical protein [Phycisphaerae bacterium]